MSSHIWRLAGIYVLVAAGIALIYYRGDRNIGIAIAVGLAAGLVIVPLEIRFMKDRKQATRDVLKRASYFEAVVAAGGIVLVILGFVIGSLRVGLSGLLFLTVALAFAGKHWLRRRPGRS